MALRTHAQLLSEIERLRYRIGQYSTRAVVTCCALARMAAGRDAFSRLGLKSPHRQLCYLVGLLLSTTEPRRPRSFTDTAWTRCCAALETIFDYYSEMYLRGNSEGAPDATTDPILVVMPAFLHYHFTTGLFASSEQYESTIRGTLVPFDDVLERSCGVSASAALEIAHWIADCLQLDLDKLNGLRRAVRSRRHRAEASPRAGRIDDELDVDDAVGGMEDLLVVPLVDLRAQFGARLADAYWSHFVCGRGGSSDLVHPT